MINFNDISNRLYQIGNKGENIPPSKNEIVLIIKKIQHLFFSEYYPEIPEGSIEEIYNSISAEVLKACKFVSIEDVDCREIAGEILNCLPNIKRMLLKDIEALYNGDPAASCREEVLISYPGFFATMVYRIAHEFYIRKVPLIPRIMTEYAHEKTGIDINAGAKIGEYFFIDHGTGIVIGETTTIGNNVKIYQGVTLGAKSFEMDENGNPIKGIKRHPDIGNNVIIYANATILGGNTRVGDGAIIGGNVWLTHSVEAGKTVYYNN